jgi:uncharacterized membrane protein YdfJ with MMPL/SSD domain
MSQSRRLLAIIVVAFAVTLSTLAPASAMSNNYAGSYYLNSVCPSNPALDAVYRAIFHGKNVVRPKNMHGKRLRRTRRALLRYERVESAGGRYLLNPPSAWPTSDSAQATKNMGLAMVRQSQIVDHLRRVAGRRFIRQAVNWFEPQVNTLRDRSSVARDSLNLPPGPQGC